jgi:hypothetical protein
VWQEHHSSNSAAVTQGAGWSASSACTAGPSRSYRLSSAGAGTPGATSCAAPPVVAGAVRTLQHPKQRISAVRVLEVRGYTFAAGEWQAPATAARSFIPSADAMHGMLMRCADALVGCREGSDEERELKAITDAIEAYELVRWPKGKIPGGKG